MKQTYGKQLPGMRLGDLPGKLIVIEGTDGAGRSAQVNLLKPWLEELGHAVVVTGTTRSWHAGEGMRRSREPHHSGRVTRCLSCAAAFVDCLEKEIVPALRAGFIVLADGYIYSLMAGATVRGMAPSWVRTIYSVALVPDAVFYLRLGVGDLLTRVVFSPGFDGWESGSDLFPSQDFYQGFCNYHAMLIEEFDRLAEEYKFEIVEAAADPNIVGERLKRKILGIVEPEQSETPGAKLSGVLVSSLADRILARLALETPENGPQPRPSTGSPLASVPAPVPPSGQLRLRRQNRFST